MGASGDESSKTPHWQARQKALNEAEADSRALQGKARKLRRDQIERDYDRPGLLWIGLAVLAILVLIGWFAFPAMRCNPLFSDLAGSRACRDAGLPGV